MERSRERLRIARKALDTLLELPLVQAPSKIVRDAAIQRFEYSFEALWKAAQMYLRQAEGLEPGSPKGVIRACMQVGVLTEQETRLAIAMVDDRNLTVHTYNEVLAEQIFARLERYAGLMTNWLSAMETRLQ